MSLTNLSIHFTKRSDKAVFISRPLLAQLKLTGIKTVKLSLGKHTIEVPVRTIKMKGNHLYLSPHLRRQLMVPRAGTCYAVSQDKNEIRLGPLIGIITTGSENLRGHFGGRGGVIRPYILAGHRKSFYFAFKPSDIHWANQSVQAYFLNDQGGWTRRVIPLPDVVYNRMASRISEKTAVIESLKENFTRRGIPIFNWNFFDKSYVYDLLKGEAEAEKNIPESVMSPNVQAIREMLSKHQFIYLKPTGGSLGRGIMRLTYKPGIGYFLRYRRNGKNELHKYAKFADIRRVIYRRTAGMRNYVCQQGINLAQIDNCPVDFRFHMNKNHRNEWVVAGIGAKKAGRGSVTTHIRNGGKLMTPENALRLTFGNRASEILEHAKRDTVRLAEIIERKSGHRVGELGFDIGIDTKGAVWMFEANAKPGRSIFKHPALKNQGRKSLRYIFEYCMYLSKFRIGGGA